MIQSLSGILMIGPSGFISSPHWGLLSTQDLDWACYTMSQVTAAQRSPLAPILSQGKAEKARGRGNGTFRIWSPFLCLTTCPTVFLQVHWLAASLQDSSTSTPELKTKNFSQHCYRFPEGQTKPPRWRATPPAMHPRLLDPSPQKSQDFLTSSAPSSESFPTKPSLETLFQMKPPTPDIP